jgi:serine/threonine protein kinase
LTYGRIEGKNRGAVMRKVVGAFIALAAMVAAAASQPGIEKERRVATEGAARRVAASTADKLSVATDSFLRAIEERAVSAAALPQINTQLALLRNQRFEGTVADTLRDFFRDEKIWEVWRRAFPVYGVSTEGGDMGLLVGAPVESLKAEPLLTRARETGASFGFLLANDAPYGAAAARVVVAGRTIPAVILLARPIDAEALTELGKRSGLSLVLSDGKNVLAGHGPAEDRTRLERAVASGGDFYAADRGSWVATSRKLVPGFTLWALADTAESASTAAATARTAEIVVWAAGALIAVLALFIGFRGRTPTVAPAPPVEVRRTLTPRPQQPLIVETTPTPLSNLHTPSPRPPAPTRVVETRDDHRDLPAGIATSPLRPFGRYILLNQLGEGGMARVYTAVIFGAEGFRRKFVVKRLRPELLEDPAVVAQFIDEANMASHLVHSNIVPVLDFGKVDDEYFLATEYILGRDLGRVVQRCLDVQRHGLPPDIVLFLAQEVLKALEYAHGKSAESGQPLGIVHRDVSPSNILVSARGEVKLFDFGIVKAEGRVTRTQQGVVKGNVSFISPEQARGLQVDQRADLFSLGLVLYTCLAGEVLYAGNSSYELLLKAATGPGPDEVQRLRRMPSPLAALLEKALTPDPAARFQTASEFLAAVTPHVGRGEAELAELITQLFADDFRQEESGFANVTPPSKPPLRASSTDRS